MLCVHHRTPLNLTSGQYLHVTGRLITKMFTNEHGKSRQAAVVKSTDILCVGSAHEDLNSIELQGLVVTDIIKNNEFSMLRVITSFVPQ